jgi:site-specific recombinase XerD
VAKRLRSFLRGRTDGPVFLAHDQRVSICHARGGSRAGAFAKAEIAGKSAHSLRHSFACGLLNRTVDLRLVQAAMNHASIVSTTIYAPLYRAKLRAAVGS